MKYTQINRKEAENKKLMELIRKKTIEMKGRFDMIKKLLFLVMIMFLSLATNAGAAVLNDAQLSSIYAGDDAILDDQITASGSAVSAQKNVAVVGSISDGTVNDTVVDNINSSMVVNAGDSALAVQTNIAAISAMGEGDNLNNVISNANDAQVDNVVLILEGAIDSQSMGTTASGAGTNSVLTSVSSMQSSVVSQSNIGAVGGTGNLAGTVVMNANTATVSNSMM